VIKARKWQHPINYVGRYPNEWSGYTFLQWSSKSGNWHEGVDYNGPGGCDKDTGMAIFAAASGLVEWWGYHKGWGWHLYIKHNDSKEGIIYSHYAHCLKDSLKVKVGDEVQKGRTIAQVGDSGWNDMCAHLHFEIRKPINEGYGFWADPKKGWDKNKVKEFYFDPFRFIENRQGIERPPYMENDKEKRIKILDKNLEKKVDELVDMRESRNKWKRKYDDETKRLYKEKSELKKHIESLQLTQSENGILATNNTQMILDIRKELKAEKIKARELFDALETTKTSLKEETQTIYKIIKEKDGVIEQLRKSHKKEVEKLMKNKNIQTKEWYKSKTLWVNIVAFIALSFQRYLGVEFVDSELQAAVLVIINFALRIYTKEAVEWNLPRLKR